MWFIIEGVARVSVPFDPINPQTRVIKVPQSIISKISEGGMGYILRDETDFPHFVRLDGRIRWYGWV